MFLRRFYTMSPLVYVYRRCRHDLKELQNRKIAIGELQPLILNQRKMNQRCQLAAKRQRTRFNATRTCTHASSLKGTHVFLLCVHRALSSSQA